MEDEDFAMAIPRAVVMACRLREHLDNFHPFMYQEGGKTKIGYGFNLGNGIDKANAIHLVKTRLNIMGNALMKQAFVSNLAGDSARFSVFIDAAERVGEDAVLKEEPMWRAAREKDWWGLHEAFLSSALIVGYGDGKDGRKRVAYLGRVLVEGTIPHELL